ncbi:MAG: DUF4837 family protein [Bacteroidetes bacterium]|nr:DUF4837 family protein [Bacteroidota bacterium]
MITKRVTLLISGFIFMISACNLEKEQEVKDDAMGEAGDIVILTDQISWNQHGKLFDSIFSAPVPGLADYEPRMVIRHADEDKFDGYFKKNYSVFVFLQRDRWNMIRKLFSQDLQDKIEQKFTPHGVVVFTAKDLWATPQNVNFVLAPNEEKMVENLRSRKLSYLQQALNSERTTSIVTILNDDVKNDTFYNRHLEQKGYSFRKPRTFRLAISADDCAGIVRDMNGKRIALYMYDEPYTEEKQFSQSYIIGRRNAVLKEHIQTERPDSVIGYMSTDTINVKLYRKQIELNGYYCIETRGWWEMENDFMAGPFVNYSILSPDKKRVITIDANIFAPGEDKNRLVRQAELIAETFRCKE